MERGSRELDSLDVENVSKMEGEHGGGKTTWVSRKEWDKERGCRVRIGENADSSSVIREMRAICSLRMGWL